MDFNAKQAARSKHRHSQHLKRVHGGRGRGRGAPSTHHTHLSDLATNIGRYNFSDEEAEQGEEELVHQSEGADLEQLLAESEQFYAQAHFRYRSFIDTIDTEPPPVDVAALEQELALDPEPLMQALALLPLSDLFGIDPEYIRACDSANDILGVDSRGQQSEVQQQQQLAVQMQQQQQESRHAMPPSLPGSGTEAMPLSTSTHAMPLKQPVPAAAAVTAPPRVVSAQTILPVHLPAAADDTDEAVLDQLLMDSKVQQPPPVAVSAWQAGFAATTAGSKNRVGTPAPWQRSAVPLPGAPTPPLAAKTPPPVAAAEGSEADDTLDELLGLCGASLPSSTQPTQQPPCTGSSKKQSLEDWLDGF